VGECSRILACSVSIDYTTFVLETDTFVLEPYTFALEPGTKYQVLVQKYQFLVKKYQFLVQIRLLENQLSFSFVLPRPPPNSPALIWA
jgi:hypothetical protein